MKKIILITMITSLLLGNDETVITQQSALNALVLKMGLKSLTEDFEKEKEKILKNTNDIEEMKRQIDYLLDQNMKLKLNVENVPDKQIRKQPEEDTRNKNVRIDEKILKTISNKNADKVNNVLNNVSSTNYNNEKIRQNNNFILANMNSFEGNVLDAPAPTAKVVRFVPRGEVMYIDYCDKFGWCKLANKEEYIAVYKLRFFYK